MAGLKKKVKPNLQEYEEFFNTVGTVFKAGTDLEVYDWKSAVLDTPKTSGHSGVPGTAKPPAQWNYQVLAKQTWLNNIVQLF